MKKVNITVLSYLKNKILVLVGEKRVMIQDLVTPLKTVDPWSSCLNSYSFSFLSLINN